MTTTSKVLMVRTHRIAALLGGLALVATACGGGAADGGSTLPDPTSPPREATTASTAADVADAADDREEGSATTASAEVPEGEAPAGSSPPLLDDLVQFATSQWPTNWDKAIVPLDEFLLGIGATDPRDAIPPIDNPVYESVTAASEWLEDRQPGALVQINGEARFYPLAIMTRHEIVNDEIDGIPVAVTYCPLCNTALTFDRRVDGQVLRFGVSGLLRNSDLVMWDDATTSLWQQITGEALVGDFAGTRLEPLSTAIVNFGDFRAGFPDGLSLSRDTGFSIAYGTNSYEGYSSRITPFIPVSGDPDNRFPAMERVVGVSTGGTDKAYPFSLLAEAGAVNDTVGGVPVVVLWGSPDTADALDATEIARSRSIGTAIALNPVVDDRVLTFSASAGAFTDAETGSRWTILGQAIEGPLAGAQLETVNHRNEFWFAWNAFFPGAAVYGE